MFLLPSLILPYASLLAVGHQISSLTFLQDMKIPDCLLKFMKSKGISSPTPIQLQGLPVAYVSRFPYSLLALMRRY